MAECAVVGVHDHINLVRPEAFVVLEAGEGDQELEGALKRHVRQHLGGNKTPREFHFMETLPRTAAGKVQRARLRERARD